MRLTTKGRFAVTAMLDLALNEANAAGQNRPVTLAGISERQHISLSYLEQLFSRLQMCIRDRVYSLPMEMKEQILTSAQRLVQQRGFNGFSYADIAAEVGIRKASLHHHFATKTDLALALIEGYSAALNTELARISALPVQVDEKLRAYMALSLIHI